MTRIQLKLFFKVASLSLCQDFLNIKQFKTKHLFVSINQQNLSDQLILLTQRYNTAKLILQFDTNHNNYETGLFQHIS